MEDDLKKVKVEYLSKLSFLNHTQISNTEEIWSVALLSPACLSISVQLYLCVIKSMHICSTVSLCGYIYAYLLNLYLCGYIYAYLFTYIYVWLYRQLRKKTTK